MEDIGSHLIDICHFWLRKKKLKIEKSHFKSLENISYDYGNISLNLSGLIINFEFTYCSWKNTFNCKILGQKGALIMNGLCKWGPSILENQKRTLPSGKPNISRFNTYGSNMIEKADTKNDDNPDIEKINSIKIDDILFEKKVSLMKIDVQGYDLEVLQGSKKTIMKQQMPIIFEYEEDFAKDFNYTFKNFENFIDEINYEISIQIDKSNYLILPK